MVNDENENKGNGYNNFDDFVILIHNISSKPRETKFRQRKLRSVPNDYEYR